MRPKDQQDQFMHRYNYDSDNRITIAQTSKDGIIWEKDAKYFYYEHGPLARTEIGEDKVQSLDYAYTIQGWLKTVNGEQVDHNTMMGQDGKQTTHNSQNGRDAFGFSLSYFDDDYQSAQTQMLNYSPSLNGAGTSIYNGNIRAMMTALVDTDENLGGAPLKTHQTTYTYDQLNRINSMEGKYRAIGQSPVASGYASNYSFDENGNLQTLQRYAHNGTNSVLMDDFTYHYDETVNNSNNNQLSWVQDEATHSITGLMESEFGDADIDGTMNSGNYVYDAIGQLITDTDEGIVNIKWKVTNKVEEIAFSSGKTIHFDYDPMGNRIAKKVINGTDIDHTFYILDAQGNPMSIYTFKTNDAKYTLSERSMYGSSRVGMENVGQELGFRTLNQIVTYSANYQALNYTGDKNYELSNHLGNVLEVITDRKLPIELGTTATTDYYTADVIAFNDYYPYGMIMSGRSGQESSGDYRYGFQGQEMDDEVKGKGNSINYKYRMHDPRIGRFFAVDPLADKLPDYSPYSFSGNKVINSIEFEGLEDITAIWPNPAAIAAATNCFYSSLNKAPSVNDATILFIGVVAGNTAWIHRPMLNNEANTVNLVGLRAMNTPMVIDQGKAVDVNYLQNSNNDMVHIMRTGQQNLTAGTQSNGIIAVPAGGGILSPNTVQSTVTGSFANGSALETGTLTLPIGFVPGVGGGNLSIGGTPTLNVNIVDNLGGVIYNGTIGGWGAGVPWVSTPGATSYTVTVTGPVSPADNFNIVLTAQGPMNAAGDGVPSNTVVTGNTTSTNTEVTVLSPPPGTCTNLKSNGCRPANYERNLNNTDVDD